MNIDTEPVKKWFGYNRQERRSSFILICLIAVMLLVRVGVPGSRMEVVELTPESELPASIPAFDPNHAPFDTLLKAGFNEREAKTLISYRNKGGRFRKPSDIRRLYGLDSAKAARLIPYIHFENDTTVSRYVRYQKKTSVELNSSDSALLVSLPGIGPVLSARIIRYRNLLGGFASVNQLKEVYGLPPETFERIRSLVYADSTLIRKVNVGTADYATLTKIPYLRRYQVTDILKYRELQGSISCIEELVKNNIIPDSLASRIRPYINF